MGIWPPPTQWRRDIYSENSQIARRPSLGFASALLICTIMRKDGDAPLLCTPSGVAKETNPCRDSARRLGSEGLGGGKGYRSGGGGVSGVCRRWNTLVPWEMGLLSGFTGRAAACRVAIVLCHFIGDSHHYTRSAPEAEHSQMLAAFKMHDFQPSANKSL